MNRVALITGGSRGIGRGIAIELARLGFDLVLNYRSDRSAAEEARRHCEAAARAVGKSIHVELIQADVSNAADRSSLIAETQRQFQRLDLLINNAGMAPRERKDLLEASEASFDELIAVNLKGPYFLTQLVARWMIDLKERQTNDYNPRIITISSISAYTASVNRGDYCVSKAGLSMLTALYATRLAPHGIQVFEIRPGIIATDMTAAVKGVYDDRIAQGLTPIRRWGEPNDVAKAVSAIAQDLFPFSTGEIINVDGGFHLKQL